MHAALGATDHGLDKLRRGGLALCASGAVARALPAPGAGRRGARTRRRTRISAAQRLHEPVPDDEQQNQQKDLSHGEGQTTGRCNSTSKTKRLPTYASSNATNDASTQRNAARPRQPDTLRAVSSAPNISHERIANTVL